MRLLLDTHISLWAVTEDPKLSRQGRSLIDDPANTVVISAVTIWEISIKNALRRSRSGIAVSARQALRLFIEGGAELLPISGEHAAAVETLPPLHGDPFDRLLVAQALLEPLRLVTHDRKVAAYSDTFILV